MIVCLIHVSESLHDITSDTFPILYAISDTRNFFFQVLQSTIYEVDLDRILQSIHIYLQELGMEEIRRRSASLG
jgi:cytoskeleton-associated protein 5